MSQPLAAGLGRALGGRVQQLRSLGGGSINDAYRASLDDGREVFVKTRGKVVPGMYEREAEGLRWLAEPGALRVPSVLHACDDFLALTFIAPAGRTGDFDRRLGEGLAQVHRAGAAQLGLERDNFIGPLPQPNTSEADWATFYGEQRLRPMVERAARSGRCDPQTARRFERLIERLPQLCGPQEPPSRLHGDLWSGNVHSDEQGHPCLIDPAVYGGHREVDLAMLQLFGSPSSAFLDAYNACYPLAPGAADRVALYELYPLLVHVNLFGGGYLSQAQAALRRYE